MGAWAAPDYGDLEPARPDSPLRRYAAALAQNFVAAPRAQDEQTLLALHGRSRGAGTTEQQSRLIDFLLHRRDSSFADLRLHARRPQTIVLVQREETEPEEVTICFCRRANCARRSPIARFDADNLPSRPYACTHVSVFGDPLYNPPATLDTPMAHYGLAEP